MSEEGEDLSDLIPTLENKFQRIGLTLKKDETTFKSTYEIMRDLAEVFEDLDDIIKADILESVAGLAIINIYYKIKPHSIVIY